jgi:4-alpha-glucanotransferase
MATDAWGIEDGYHDIRGDWHATAPAVRRQLRIAMGGLGDVEDPPPQTRPVWFVRHGAAPAIERPAELVLEDGTTVQAVDRLPRELPLGYHELLPSDGGPATRLIVAPARCHLSPRERSWGWAVQLYAARSENSWGIGDLGDLRTMARWSAGLGAGYVAVNPLHAPRPLADPEPSPYFPSTRRFCNPLYLRIEEVPGFDPADPALAEVAAAGRALNGSRVVYRNHVHALKLFALDRLWGAFEGDARFDAYVAEQGGALRQYATYCALAEKHDSGWTSWPSEHRRADGAGVERFATANDQRVRFHSWIQWLLDEQLAGAADELAMLGDLAVGVDPEGADAWVWRDVLAPGVRIGAPPDAFNLAGQDWGLPPFVPWKLRAVGYEPFVQTVRAALRHAGALRIDHVMGLFRLFWIPEGRTAAEGTYVRYPGSELLDIVALESNRAGAEIVGEDLGTVEDEVRDQLADRAVLSYRVVWFEPDPPEWFPEAALAAVSTHDLPTIPGVWTGADLDEQHQAGLDPNEAGLAAHRRRLQELTGLSDDAPVADVVLATYRRLARAPSRVRLASLEDALRVEERPNVPGTTVERANWSLALPLPLDAVFDDPGVRAVAATMSDPDAAVGI